MAESAWAIYCLGYHGGIAAVFGWVKMAAAFGWAENGVMFLTKVIQLF